VTRLEHSATSARASAWETTPCRAVQKAAWEVLMQHAYDLTLKPIPIRKLSVSVKHSGPVP
jgi:hypothetical protein